MFSARPGPIRRVSIVAGAASLMLIGALGAAPSTNAQLPTTAGTPELFNLEHVYNFNPENHEPGRDPFRGSDLEFFTHSVPLRDYSTGQLLDESGNPLPAGADPVLAERDFAVMGSYQRGGYIFDITNPEEPQFVTQVTCRQPRNDVGIKKFTDPATGETRVVLALTQQTGNPCGDAGGVGVRVDAPAELQGFHDGVQWSGTAPVADQTARLVYAGTGCTAASYAPVLQEIRGNIALVDDRVSETDEADTCPLYTFFQKVRTAQEAGAIGFVQIVEEGDEPNGNATAVAADIPALELNRTPGILDVRDVVIAGTEVEATLTDGPSSVPLLGSGSGGIGVFDITDPFEWRPMYRFRTGFGGVHNFIFHPTKPYGYVSNGALPGAINEIPIIDFTDLDDPVLLTGRAPTIGGAHDLEFSPNGDRAYVASENNYRIFDTTDPANPVLVSGTTPNVGTYAHGVFPTSDLSLMVTNNESLLLGGFLESGTGVCPGEGLASYDITSEGTPIGPLGYYVPNVIGQTDDRPCTSHFGRFAPETKVMSIGWYIAGTRVVDWSDPANPVELAAAVLEGTNQWAAKFYKGPYIYAGDIGRGFDVFRWTGDGPAPWLPKAQAPDLVVQDVTTASKVRDGHTAEITATIANIGTGDAGPSTTEFVLDGNTTIGSAETQAIAAGDSTEVSVFWDTAGVKGEHTIRVTADAGDAVDEAQEGNNAGALTVHVRGNKVTNGSFEQESTEGGGPEGWSGSNTAAGEATWSDDGIGGSKGVAMTGTGGSALLHGSPTWTSDAIEVTPGQVLDLVVSVDTNGTSSAPSVGLQYLGATGQVLDTVGALTAPLVTDGFALLEEAVTIPDTVAEVRIVLRGFALTDTGTSGRVVFDDVGLYEG